MRVTNIKTCFTEEDLKQHSPFVYGLHKLRYEGGNFHEVMLGYHESAVNVPFYEFTKTEMTKAIDACELVYGALYDIVGALFDCNDRQLMAHYYGTQYGDGTNFIHRYPQFVDYAKYTYEKSHPAIYGRFDMYMDQNGTIKFYEFNGDTPTMLFESSCVQDVMLDKVGLRDYQHNWWYEYFQDNIVEVVKPGSVVAVVAKMDITTDAMTAEYIHNALTELGYHSILMNFSELMYDELDRQFHYDGTIVDAVYILKPWEEMVDESPDIIGQWTRWGNSVLFFEPAWRWFTSNKGVWALMCDALYTNKLNDIVEFNRFATKYRNTNLGQHLIPSYMESDKPDHVVDYVVKPIIGRCSSSIRVFREGELVSNTGGWYSDVKGMVQQWTPPPNIDDRDQFVTCMWMAPYGYHVDKMTMTGALMTIRECKGSITNIQTESVYPCMVVDDDHDDSH